MKLYSLVDDSSVVLRTFNPLEVVSALAALTAKKDKLIRLDVDEVK